MKFRILGDRLRYAAGIVFELDEPVTVTLYGPAGMKLEVIAEKRIDLSPYSVAFGPVFNPTPELYDFEVGDDEICWEVLIDGKRFSLIHDVSVSNDKIQEAIDVLKEYMRYSDGDLDDESRYEIRLKEIFD